MVREEKVLFQVHLKKSMGGKTMKRKIYGVLVCILMVFTIAGCSSDQAAESTTEKKENLYGTWTLYELQYEDGAETESVASMINRGKIEKDELATLVLNEDGSGTFDIPWMETSLPMEWNVETKEPFTIDGDSLEFNIEDLHFIFKYGEISADELLEEAGLQ